MSSWFKGFVTTAALLTFATEALSQSSFVPLGSSGIHMLDRFEIRSGRLATPLEFNSSTKAYRRSSIARYVDSFEVGKANLSKQDFFNLDYLQNDNFEWSHSESTRSARPLLGALYRHKAALFDHVEEDFNVVVNPVAYLQYGYDNNRAELVNLNMRGLQIRGSIRKGIGFYTEFTDVIHHPNSWVLGYYRQDSVIPGAGFLKTTDQINFNYGIARGALHVDLGKYIDLQFGHGSNFIGNGYRSLFLSDFSRDHLFLRANTHFWKINYTNIWGMMYNYVPVGQVNLPKRHYYAATHLSMNITRNLNLGLFQVISYQRDSGYSGGPELEYLNPIIFYKPIENGLNSPDKAMLGMDLKYNFLKHFSAYVQFAISEFVLAEVLANKGWFGNKQAMQVGLKYIDVAGIRNLDLQLEYNQARPYMYTSFNRLNAYVNYNQPMAHPLGANFRELIGVLRYQPLNRLFLKGTAIYTITGNDTMGSNWGKDIRLSYRQIPQAYGNEIGQGVGTNIYLLDFLISWMPKHNLFLDLQCTYRNSSSDLPQFDARAIVLSAALRLNISEKRWDF